MMIASCRCPVAGLLFLARKLANSSGVVLVGTFLSLVGCRQQAIAPTSSFGAALLDFAEAASRELKLDLPSRQVTERRLAELTQRARGELGPRCQGRGCVDRLGRLLFGELGFRREIDDRSLPPGLLPWVLERRRGSCLGLGALYLALGEPLGLALEGVLVPGHFFVRYLGPDGARGIELLKEGRDMPESWYRRRYHVPKDNPLYLTGLRAEQALAVLRFNEANAFRDRGDLARALEEYRHVAEQLPDFAEAQANLGLTYHRLGDYSRAEQSYRRAARAHPDLPGLRENLALLHREWRGRFDLR